MRAVSIIAAALIAGSLASCALLTVKNPITQDRVVTIKEGYGVALAAAVTYRDSCAQRLIPPSCRTIVPKLVAANKKIELAIANLDRVQALGADIDPSEAIRALSDAVNDFKILMPSNGSSQ